jgi:hypothetical protein
MNEVLIGTGNHKFNILVTIGEQIIALIMVLICIHFKLGILVLIIPGYFQTAFKQGFGWWFINKKIINLKINPWQNWIAPFCAGICYYLLFWGIRDLLSFIFPPLVVIIIFVLLGIYFLPICYFFALGLFGGYDVHTLEDLRKGADLSGPSKIVVKPWYYGAKAGSKISPLFGKFAMQYQGVGEEIRELMLAKKAHQLKKVPTDDD